MKRMKNVILLVLCFLFLSGCINNNEEQVKKYIKEKHGIDVVVTDWGAMHEGNMGHTYHTVQAKNNKNIQFRVEVDGFLYSKIKGDEYQYGKNTYEEYKKFKPILKEIKKLGYEEFEKENVLQYIVDYHEDKPTDDLLLTLKTSNKIDYSQFESAELDRLYALFQLIQKSNKKITELEIKDHNGEYIGLPFENVQKVITKEELLLKMKNTLDNYWTYLIQTQTKVGDRLKEIQNDDFVIEGITCPHPKDGECPKYKVTLVFKDSKMQYKNKPPVIEDLTKVVTILREELYNEKFDIFLTNKDGTRYSLWLSSETIKKSNNIEELIK
ncbi:MULTISPECIES: hypothetical protein [Bacillus]|uniref:hypothetical protein n=1 Tax=Bacillus TaxID=1386 RepID=UPI0001A18C4A|nr:hypothetical protein [Bacillus pseudomycoides]EEM13418.1 hypothetical protein bpmyx0001_57750 [Bacillus pseudomycoides DSM 12442]MED1597493.1 hypothetical protein [Bacillus pseudomycoides]MED4712132.1 hypothetical protein [Bacillus pseudomycoides]OOR51610.1 hypothetical protein BLX05_13125 [Bacillus pseudomycoides]PDY10352.1 hypothetical protein COO16_20585 [Bacillus pseudomycoides]